jgi:hypothetical protein
VAESALVVFTAFGMYTAGTLAVLFHTASSSAGDARVCVCLALVPATKLHYQWRWRCSRALLGGGCQRRYGAHALQHPAPVVRVPHHAHSAVHRHECLGLVRAAVAPLDGIQDLTLHGAAEGRGCITS